MTAGLLGVVVVAAICVIAVLWTLRKQDAAAQYAADVATGRILQLSLEAHQAMLREAIAREVGRL